MWVPHFWPILPEVGIFVGRHAPGSDGRPIKRDFSALAIPPFRFARHLNEIGVFPL
jgi:hypothetical protein